MYEARDGRYPRLQTRYLTRFLAPDWQEKVTAFPASALLLLMLVMIVALAIKSGSRFFEAILVVAALLGAPILLKALNSRVRITPEVVECRDALRRTRRCQRSDLTRLVKVPMQMLGTRYSLTRVLMLDASGRARLRLQVDDWSDAQLDQIERVLALPMTDMAEPLTSWQANRQFPGGASLAFRLWPLVALAVGAAAFLLFGFALELLHRH